ncbi:MAG: CsgG/HfaB family protein [Vicinamibacterales bacterium]|nr:CsgG/HfaB family protein [Vicinamibacterales bacterium]
MRKAFWSVLAVAVILLAVVASPALAQSKSTRPTVAVLDFDYGSINNWWGGNWDIGKGIADMLVDGLLEDGSYRLIERKKLDAILGEQDFSNSDRADPSAASVARVGKALGVKYMVVGTITKFGTEESKKSIGGGGFGGRILGGARVGKQEGKANVAITARIIDTSTGEIMASAKGEGTSKRSGMLLSGGGAIGGTGGGAGVSMSSSDYKESILGEATEAAVLQVVAKLVAARDRLE